METVDNDHGVDIPLDLLAWCLLAGHATSDDPRDRYARQVEGSVAPIADFAQLILERLPAPPARILDLRESHAILVKEFARYGYVLTGVDSQITQGESAAQRAETGAALPKAPLEQVERTAVPRAVCILLRHASCTQDLLGLLNRAYDLLDEDGQLFFVDEFAVELADQDPLGSPASLKAVVAQAERCGFSFQETLDLTAAAAAAADGLRDVLKYFPSTPLADLATNPDHLNCQRERLDQYAERQRCGRFVYKMLHLRKAKPPRWRITLARPPDQAAVRALFNEVFAPEQLSPELWEWKYGGGRGLAVLAWQGERLVAHYGGMVRSLRYFGRDAKGVQIGDVMVAKAERSVLTRSGVFYRTGATFLEHWIGFGSLCLIGYGFPTAQAMKVGERVGLYAEVDRIVELRWTACQRRPRLSTRVRDPRLPRDAAHVDALWQQMAADLADAIVAVRDSGYLQRRYLNHPHKAYRLVLFSRRLTGTPLGLMVFRRTDDAAYSLLDYIGPLRHLRACIGQARRVVASWGGQRFSAWITDGFARAFENTDATFHATDVRIPNNIHTAGPSTSRLRGRWWLTGGDTDFN